MSETSNTPDKGTIRLFIYWILSGLGFMSILKLILDWPLLEMFLGMGLFFICFFLFATIKKMYYITNINPNEDRMKLVIGISKIIVPTFYTIFALYSGYIVILSDVGRTSIIINVIWLILLIFAFQVPPMMLSIYLWHKGFSPRIVVYSFLGLLAFLELIFGWASAQLSESVIFIPRATDLLTIVYGQICLLVIFFILLRYLSKNVPVSVTFV